MDEVQVSVIVNDPDTISRVYQMLANDLNMPFDIIAHQYSLHDTKEQFGDMGIITRGMLSQELEDVIFALEVGQIAQPVVYNDECYLFKRMA